jgi:outer membrane autotransporter protein
LFVNGIVSYGGPTTDLARNVVYPSSNTCPTATPCPSQNRTLTGSPDSRSLAAGLTVGHDFNLNSWDLDVSVSANYRHVKIDSFQETDTSGGGLALAYDEQTIKSFRSILGLNLSRAISTSFGVISPNVRAEWHHEFEVGQRNLQAKYALDATPGSLANNFTTCDSCFAIPQDRPDSNFGVVGAGLSVLWPHRLQGYVFYERLVSDTYLTSNAIALGIRGVF